MSRPTRPLRRLTIEALLWAAVFLTAFYVLVPAVVERQQASLLEQRMEQRHRRTEGALAEASRDLDVLVHDPETDDKLRERPVEPDRRPAGAGKPAPSTPGTR